MQDAAVVKVLGDAGYALHGRVMGKRAVEGILQNDWFVRIGFEPAAEAGDADPEPAS